MTSQVHRTSATAPKARATVAHVTTVPESLELLLSDQLAALQSAGYLVTGISAPGPVVRLSRLGIRHLAVPFVRSSGLTPGADLGALAALVRLFRRERFTIVHTHTAKADLYATLAARMARVPFVVTTLHGFVFDDHTPLAKRRLYTAAARLGMAACNAVLSQNEEDVETARRERICAPHKISVLGNGIDVLRFDPARLALETRARIRHELGIPAGALVIGFVGRLVAEKGIHELLQAFARLHDRFDVHLLLIGPLDTAKRDALTPASIPRGVEHRVHFTGHRDDMPELYAAMDVCTLPSHREGFPRTLMEAAAMSLPVVASDIRGCRSAVENGRSGLLVTVKDSVALEAALAQLLARPDQRANFGRTGHQLARREFDQRRVFTRVLATYDRLLATSS